MTMDDYLDMRAYWAAHPPLQSLAEAYFKLKPKRVSRPRGGSKNVEQPDAPNGASWFAAFPNGIIR
jgi:hypothetical protein